ncbi:minor protein FimE [Porphyromonas gulae]|nr:minor protein FimE [Porphyromonas gulae]
MKRTMKKFQYILLLLLLTSCVADRHEPCPGQMVEVRGSIIASEYPVRIATFNKENAVESLELWVFDEDGCFLERAAANISGQNFTATITASDKKRTIHFIANYNLLNPQTWVGHSQKEMVPSFSVQDDQETIRMWAKKTYDTGIATATDLGQIKLLRNMAKFALYVAEPSQSKLYDVSFSLYNSLNKGTLAPFNPSTGEFVNDYVTEPAGTTFAAPQPFKPAGDNNFFYGFERENSIQTEITCLIVKAKYETPSAAYSYYKIDLVNADKDRYDVIRNHFYKVSILQAKTAGYPSIEGALQGAAANNIALSPEVQVFPSFSDGTGLLTVNSTYMAFVNKEATGYIIASYTPQGSTTAENNKIVVDNVTHINGQAVMGVPVNDGNGKITLTLNQNPPSTGAYITDIVLGITGNPDLKRKVRIVVRNPYSYDLFQANGQAASNNVVNVALPTGQAKPLTVKAKLPEVFNEALLPITFKVFTENFYPANPGMTIGIEGGKTLYKYVLTTMPQNREFQLPFKSNKVESSEDIIVKMNYFYDQRIQVTN